MVTCVHKLPGDQSPGSFISAPIAVGFFLTQTNVINKGIKASTPETIAIMVKFDAAKTMPLPRLPVAEASPTSRSFVPCVRERSKGESWSASNAEPPTKQKFQPRPSKKSATANGKTSGDSGAVMHASSNVNAPVRITGPRPHRSARRPEMTEKANIPRVWDAMTAEISLRL